MSVTLALIKPEICAYPQLCWALIERIKTKFSISGAKRIQFNGDMIGKFYGSHKGKFYFNRMKSHMCSGPSIALILRSDHNVVESWRQQMGPTKSHEAKLKHPECIRCHFGLTDHRNAVHGSGTIEEAQQEVSLIFPDFNLNNNSCNDDDLRICVFPNKYY